MLENWIAVLGGRDSVMLSAKTHHSSTPLEAGCALRLNAYAAYLLKWGRTGFD
jgi:hypothetical protein